MAKVKVEMTGLRTGKVWVDGVEQQNVVAVRFECDIERDVPASIEIVQRLHGVIEIEGEMDANRPASA